MNSFEGQGTSHYCKRVWYFHVTSGTSVLSSEIGVIATICILISFLFAKYRIFDEYGKREDPALSCMQKLVSYMYYQLKSTNDKE